MCNCLETGQKLREFPTFYTEIHNLEFFTIFFEITMSKLPGSNEKNLHSMPKHVIQQLNYPLLSQFLQHFTQNRQIWKAQPPNMGLPGFLG